MVEATEAGKGTDCPFSIAGFTPESLSRRIGIPHTPSTVLKSICIGSPVRGTVALYTRWGTTGPGR